MSSDLLLNKNSFIFKFPKEIQKYIFKYISLKTESANLINNIILVYNLDHNWSYTKLAKLYYIKNILEFHYYVFDSLTDPYEYLYGPKYYDSSEKFYIEDDSIF